MPDGPRHSWLGPLREPIRRTAFRLLRDLLKTDDGRRLLADSLNGVDQDKPDRFALSLVDERVYPDLNPQAGSETIGPAPVFLTGRFRSGSTLLWNLFRNVPDCTSFYEPLNERRWFDPGIRGQRVDKTHLGVEEYWREYEGLERLGSVVSGQLDRPKSLHVGAFLGAKPLCVRSDPDRRRPASGRSSIQ